MHRTLVALVVTLSLPACVVSAAPTEPVPVADAPVIDCAAVQCIAGMLHGVDCTAVTSSCDGTCDGYLACTASCTRSSPADPFPCVQTCGHGSYAGQPGGVVATSSGAQFLACACCQ
jgi:hypothetical protein